MAREKPFWQDGLMLYYSSWTIQVPQYILDSMWAKEKACKIVCTQPRRISATSGALTIVTEYTLFVPRALYWHFKDFTVEIDPAIVFV